MPWEIIVDYNATTGWWFIKASFMWGATDKMLEQICFMLLKFIDFIEFDKICW